MLSLSLEAPRGTHKERKVDSGTRRRGSGRAVAPLYDTLPAKYTSMTHNK